MAQLLRQDRLRFHDLDPQDDLNYRLPRTPQFSPPVALRPRDAGWFAPADPLSLPRPGPDVDHMLSFAEPIAARLMFGPLSAARDAGVTLGDLLRHYAR